MTTFLTPPSPLGQYEMVNLSLVSSISATTNAQIIFYFLDSERQVRWEYESREDCRAAFEEIMNTISINPRAA